MPLASVPLLVSPVDTSTAAVTVPAFPGAGGGRAGGRVAAPRRGGQPLAADLVRQTGQIISDPAAVGGFGSLAGGTPPTDTDRDGMPDAWERERGLDPANAGDGDGYTADGYTNVEQYLNSLVP